MKHARTDYNRIQDPIPEELGGIPVQEPVFLLRGKDKFAPMALLAYADLVEAEGNHDALLVHNTRQQAMEMSRWQKRLIGTRTCDDAGLQPDMPPHSALFPLTSDGTCGDSDD